jgi:hypothetical protein
MPLSRQNTRKTPNVCVQCKIASCQERYRHASGFCHLHRKKHWRQWEQQQQQQLDTPGANKLIGHRSDRRRSLSAVTGTPNLRRARSAEMHEEFLSEVKVKE